MSATLTTSPNRRRTMSRIVIGAAILVGLFAVMQLPRFVVPGLKLDNPSVTQTFAWDSPETARLWETACADCHSNETVYPWYSYVAPVGWLVARDVHEGRDHLNVSEDARVDVDEMIEVIQEGEMPMPIYTIMHSDAKLSDFEQQQLMNGLRTTFGAGSAYEDERDDEDDD